MVAAFIILAISGLLGAGILFKQQRLLTYIATAGALWDGQWLLLTLLDRTVFRQLDANQVYLVGAVVLLLPWLGLIKKWTSPYKKVGAGRRDLAVMVVLLGVLLASFLVQSKNGYINGEWVMHGFYNGDTMTMISLVQRSMLEDGLVSQNPFAGNGYLEYPSLWHAGLATIVSGLGLDMEWIHFIEALTYLQIVMVVPMFFLVMDLMWPEPERKEEKWLGVSSRVGILMGQAVLIGYVMAVSWDNYIYPQTHFFLTGLLLLVVAALMMASKEKGRQECWYLTIGGLVSLMLLLSNAVTGAVAVAVSIVYYGWRLVDSRGDKLRRLAFLGGIMAWLVVYIALGPGDASWGWPHFSYTSAESIMRLTPIIIALGLVLMTRERRNWLDLVIVATMAMTLITFMLSQRNIIVANAERFIYHGLLIGFSLLLAPMVQFYFWIKRVVGYTAQSMTDRIAVAGGVIVLLSIILLPALISGARAHDQLMRQDEHVINFWHREALDHIRREARADDIVLANPKAPWVVPMLTGRSLLRTDYWLGSYDDAYKDVELAWRGDSEAQRRSLQRSDYLLIKQDEIIKWELEEYEKVFRSGQYTVYKTDKER